MLDLLDNLLCLWLSDDYIKAIICVMMECVPELHISRWDGVGKCLKQSMFPQRQWFWVGKNCASRHLPGCSGQGIRSLPCAGGGPQFHDYKLGSRVWALGPGITGLSVLWRSQSSRCYKGLWTLPLWEERVWDYWSEIPRSSHNLWDDHKSKGIQFCIQAYLSMGDPCNRWGPEV